MLYASSVGIKTANNIKSYWIQKSWVTLNKFIVTRFTNMELCNRSWEKDTGPSHISFTINLGVRSAWTDIFRSALREISQTWNNDLKQWLETLHFNPLSANPIKRSNTLKPFVGKLPTNCFNVFNHFVGLDLKGLRMKKFQLI